MPEHSFSLAHWTDGIAAQFEKANLYFGHGTDNAWDEALHLLTYVLEIPLPWDLQKQYHVNSEQQRRLTALIDKRIKERLPLPYITHQAWFMGLSFYVDERVLIPRSPLGEWIQKGFVPWVEKENVKNILDFGTGSGCLAISCALVFKNAAVEAIDNEREALAVATTNISHYGLTQRIKLIHSDGFKSLEEKKYDIILSNPPYVSQKDFVKFPKEYHHEPKEALVAPEEGLALVTEILRTSKHYLKSEGILVMEVGYQADKLQQRYPKVPFLWLEQEHGGEGLLLLEKEQMDTFF